MWIKKLAYLQILTLSLILTPLLIWGIDVKPWINNDFEVEIHTKLLFQQYNTVQIPHRNYNRSANDYFWTLSGAFPFRKYRGEFEFTTAHTHHQNHRIDNFRLSWAYQIMDDTAEAPFSLMAGLILTEPLSRALHDLSSFHHGHINAETFISIGKRMGPWCSKDFHLRYWNVIGFGCSDIGSGWIREEAAIELKRGVHYFRFFTNTLWGLGRENINLRCFEGYGRIRHQSIDVGFRYGYCLGCFGTLSLQYARRVYAHNFPQDANLVLLEYYLPFGRQNSTTY